MPADLPPETKAALSTSIDDLIKGVFDIIIRDLDRRIADADKEAAASKSPIRRQKYITVSETFTNYRYYIQNLSTRKGQ